MERIEEERMSVGNVPTSFDESVEVTVVAHRAYLSRKF